MTETIARTPKHDEVVWPVLHAIQTLETATNAEIDEHAFHVGAYSPEQRAVLHGDGPKSEIEYRFAWARTDLGNMGLIEKGERRGTWTITDAGRSMTEDGLLQPYREYLSELRLASRARTHRLKNDPASSHSSTSNAYDLAITGDETIEELVDLWYEVDPYPNDKDKVNLQRLEDFRHELGPERIATAPIEALKRVMNRGENYGFPGGMTHLNILFRDGTEAEIQQYRDTLQYLMYGDDPIVDRLHATIENDSRWRVRGLNQVLAMKFLAIAYPNEIVPLYPYVPRSGSKGKRSALQRLPLDFDVREIDALPTVAGRQIRSNKVLVEKVGPLMRHGHMWELQRFLWWATHQFELLDEVVADEDDAPENPPVVEDDDDPIELTGMRRAATLDELAASTFMQRELLAEIANALRSDQPHVILAGPPGTSKTFIADNIAAHLTGDGDAITTIQLHPSYGYEEFVEGLRPTTGDGGELKFEPEAGPLLRVADAARRDAESVQVLIIDEMNRANLPRVFGELLYLLEYRDRSLDLRFHPAFTLPENVAFIGTMNTADRSIRSIDAAIRRRFEIFEFMPDSALLERWYASDQGVSHIPDLRAGFDRLNDRLTDLLDRHHTVGHAFLIEKELTADKLRRIWRRKIGPLVEEYLFDRPELARELTLEWCWPSMSDQNPTT